MGSDRAQSPPDWEPKLCSAHRAAQTPPVAQTLDNHSPGTDPDNVLLITLFPKVSPLPVKIKTRGVVKTCSAPNGAAILVLGDPPCLPGQSQHRPMAGWLSLQEPPSPDPFRRNGLRVLAVVGTQGAPLRWT